MELSFALNADYIDSQYQLWKADPNRVSREWQLFFEGFELAAPRELALSGVCDKRQVLLQSRVEELIYRYRDLGHLLACLDPLSACPTDHPLLNLAAFDLTEEDLDRTFYAKDFSETGEARLREIIQALRETYCRSIGVEYMHLQDPQERRWLQERMEPIRNRLQLDRDAKLRIVNKLCQATLFEQFLNSRYVGQTRFSMEGAEGILAMMDALVQHVTEMGCQEVILGMPHRGRLNVEVNILEKLYEIMFCEFETTYDPESLVGSGDVKYHRGYLSEIKSARGKTLHMLLVSNPSHLEAVNPVIEGAARARQDQLNDQGGRLVLPLLIHGDAAFSGQGVVFETLNLSQLEGYRTGGTFHIVINNQIGFTTLPEDARSTRYTTDVAKMLMVPIFHVHGEDPEALVHVAKLAFDYRAQFGKDVVIDVICYRRYGHNEGDEPYYTQPQMYERIRSRPPLYQVYAEKLIKEGITSTDELERIKKGINDCMETGYQAAHGKPCDLRDVRFYGHWEEFVGQYSHEPVETGVARDRLVAIARKLDALPEGFSIHQRLQKILARRVETVEKGEGIDWGTAEALAFGSILLEGLPIRLSGQDSRRGTFSQRHSLLVDTKTGAHFTPLSHLGEGQGRFSVYDSLLSEYAALGFEYGYSLIEAHGLTAWEAQYGDFVNNAQTIIDEFITSGEIKWLRLSGLVMLLPHGYEGHGPDHSTARIERYLQMCAENNMDVCNPTTPSQYFHLLRRQVKRKCRKPLIVFTPKSLLRHSLAASKISEMTSGHFQEILPDEEVGGTARRVLLCSGKIYYDLLEKRRELGVADIAIVRFEQLYPLSDQYVKEAASRYSGAQEWYWVQEEPQNMGAWMFMRDQLQDLIGKRIEYIGRARAASPATGFSRIHKDEQAAIVNKAIPGNK